MKTTIKLLIVCCSLCLPALTGCDLTVLNENPNQPGPDVAYNFDDARLAGAFRGTLPVMDGDDEQRIKSLNIDFHAQMLDGGGYDIKNYFSNDEWNQRMYRRVQSAVAGLNIVIRNLTPKGDEYAKSLAVAKIWRVYVQSIGVDYFGPIPFASYTVAEDNPPYKSVQDNYTEFFKELSEAIVLLDTEDSEPIFMSAVSDIVFGNDITRWKRFAASLHLRLAMRLSEADENTCKTEIAKALTEGVIESADDNARVPPRADGGWGADYNYTMFQIGWSGPLSMTASFEKLVENIGGIAWNGSIVNQRAVYNNQAVEKNVDENYTHPTHIDPRATLMFDPPFAKPETGGNAWKGLPVGLSASDRAEHADEYDRNYYPELGILFKDEVPYKSRPYDVFLYEEVCFLKAEAFLRGFDAGDAKSAYEEGVRASFATWGVADLVDDYLASTAKNLAGTSAHFDDENGAGNTKLEKIITQKYLALFPDISMEAWSDKRRLNLPRMDVPASRNELLYNNSDKDIRKSQNFIKRVQYPQNEQQINKEEYAKALNLLGGIDAVSTPIWWDKNSNYCTSAE
ncbi:MAG: SusD/RagB family nutrient-binding outer membrane lipoprotein [Tannerellaceae bacterium]|jgi:hypothetical protein|nr:SusD/RagB family nutrient-binding outer membrane lipoprotein [Tannerellaceae bacterium]